MSTDAVKPGVQTSEFWTHVVSLAVAVGTGVAGVIHPGFSVPALVSELSAPAAALLALGSQVAYTVSRTGLKKAALPAVGAVIAAQGPDVDAAISAALAGDPRLAGVANLDARIHEVVKSEVGPVVSDLTALRNVFGGTVNQAPALVAPVATVDQVPAPTPEAV